MLSGTVSRQHPLNDSLNAETFSEELKHNSATYVFDNISIASLSHEPLVKAGNEEQREQMKSEVRWFISDSSKKSRSTGLLGRLVEVTNSISTTEQSISSMMTRMPSMMNLVSLDSLTGRSIIFGAVDFLSTVRISMSRELDHR